MVYPTTGSVFVSTPMQNRLVSLSTILVGSTWTSQVPLNLPLPFAPSPRAPASQAALAVLPMPL